MNYGSFSNPATKVFPLECFAVYGIVCCVIATFSIALRLRSAIELSSNGHEKTKETSKLKKIMNFKKGNSDPEKVTKQGEDIVRVSVWLIVRTCDSMRSLF